MAAPAPDVLAIASLLKRERAFTLMQLKRTSMSPANRYSDSHPFRYEGDVEDFLRRSAQTNKSKINVIHSSFDPVDIHVRGNRAISEAFCLITSSITLDGVDYELASHMRLFTRLQKLTDLNEWRLLSLESSYVRDRLVTASPGADKGVQLSMMNEAQAYPKSYRHLALVTLNRGLKPRPDLPDEDHPESIRRIVDQNRAFLDTAEA